MVTFPRSVTLPTWPPRLADVLVTPSIPGVSRRRWLFSAAIAGLAVGLFSRAWMRAISDEPQFSVPGTLLILIVFSGLGALTGLASWWLRTASPRRPLVQRGVAFLPLVLMGPFVVLFVPGFILAGLQARRFRRRWIRWPLFASAGLMLAFLVLVFAQRPSPLAAIYAPAGYSILATALYLSNRIALAPRRGVLL